MNRRRCLLALTTVALSAQGAPNVSGKWHFVLQTEDGERVIEPTFQQDGNKVTGKWRDSDVKGTFSNGKLDVDVPVNSEEVGPGILKLKGALAGESLSGDWTFLEYKGTFRATRVRGDEAAPSVHGSRPHF
jgi:hypothetical protein